MSRRGSEGGFSTTELDPRSLEGLLDAQEREPKPTTVMHRDELMSLVHATAPASVSEHAVPRVLLERRAKIASSQAEPIDTDLRAGVSPLLVLAIIGILVGMFVAVVATA